MKYQGNEIPLFSAFVRKICSFSGQLTKQLTDNKEIRITGVGCPPAPQLTLIISELHNQHPVLHPEM